MDAASTANNTTKKIGSSHLVTTPLLQAPPGGHLAGKPTTRGSGSYPNMLMVTGRRTGRRSHQIMKRRSDSFVICGGGLDMVPPRKKAPPVAFDAQKSKTRRHQQVKKKNIKATRKKSLENLGLVVRNRCGSAKFQWPADKKETELFDLLPEGCLQVRQLGLQKSSRSLECTCTPISEQNQKEDTPDLTEDNEDEDNYFDYSDDTEHGDASHQEALLAPNNIPTFSQGHHKSREDLDNPKSNFSPENNNGPPTGATKTDWKNQRNISVIVRIRPKQRRELEEKSIVFRTDAETIVFDPKEKTKDFYFQGVKQSTRNDFGRKRPNRNASFQFDKVYGPDATNKQIFTEMLQDLTDHLIDGYNSTVFAYGVTGSGKTYTMIGSGANPGLTVLMVESLYRKISLLSKDFESEVMCSYLEVYNEGIKDLLRPDKELFIREDGKKGIIIPELSYYQPRGPSELLKLLRSGNRARTQHATDLNAESSRSHAVFEVRLSLKRKQRKKDFSPEEAENKELKVEIIQSKLVMVDLAGSERGSASLMFPPGGVLPGTASSGGYSSAPDGSTRQREGANINKSLLALANCISALADGKSHVPFRNSKLTRLLKDALTGNCTTVMIANISPSSITSEDTYNTLKYADRAMNIVGPEVKMRNVILEDLILEDDLRTKVATLQAKVDHLMELLEEEKRKNRRLSKKLAELEEKKIIGDTDTQDVIIPSEHKKEMLVLDSFADGPQRQTRYANPKTFTVSRETLPASSIPVIPSPRKNNAGIKSGHTSNTSTTVKNVKGNNQGQRHPPTTSSMEVAPIKANPYRKRITATSQKKEEISKIKLFVPGQTAKVEEKRKTTEEEESTENSSDEESEEETQTDSDETESGSSGSDEVTGSYSEEEEEEEEE